MYSISKKRISLLLCVLLVFSLISVNISKSEAQSKKVTFKIWWYERENAMDAAWRAALEEFKKKHPEVNVQFEQKAFEQVQQTAKMVLNSKDVPDVMEINKGNSTAGLYAKEGLLTELDSIASQKGWDKILKPSLQITCRYDKNGIMGSGKLYGITTYGEFVMVYYNKDMFDKYNLKPPKTLAEFENICNIFVKNKITPFVIGAADKWPITQNWYEIALYKADRKFINNFQLLKDDINFKGPEFSFATEKFIEYSKKGYFEKKSNGIKYDDANNAFYQGKYPMILTGSWLFGAVKDKVKKFKWGVFLLPAKKLNTGSGGNLWVVPKNAKNKELAYEFIDLTLQKKYQTLMAQKGGIPINAELSQITDPDIKEVNSLFAKILQQDGLAFYPDWPVPGYMDVLGGALQDLLAGRKNKDQFLNTISKAYFDYKKSVTK